mgnify:CR=1 FL=1
MILFLFLDHLRKYFIQKNRKFDQKLYENGLKNQTTTFISKQPTNSNSSSSKILGSFTTASPPSAANDADLEHFLANTFIGLKKNTALSKLRFNLTNLAAQSNHNRSSSNKNNALNENRLSTLIVEEAHSSKKKQQQ